MNLTKLAIENDRVTILLVIILAVLGLVGYNQLARDSMPPFTIRICTVVTRFPGADPQRVEELVTNPIEEAAQELPELKTVTSESRTGISIVSVEVVADIDEKDLQPIWDRLRRKIEAIEGDLPDGALPPEVKDDGIGTVYGIALGLEGDGYTYKQLEEYADELRDELIKLPDAAEVEIRGVRPEQIFIEFDNARLAEIGLSSSQLQQIIGSTNIVFSGGEVSLEKKRIVLEPTGNYESLEDLGNTLIPIQGTRETIELGDITRISRGYEQPAKNLVRINGRPGVGISVALRENANLTELGVDVNRVIERYNANMPIGLNLSRIASQDVFVEAKIDEFISNVIQSVGIVLLVMLLFLGLRTGLVVASLIPMAIITTLFLMNGFNIGLNQVSLAALIMALGLLVDNAIVMAESIMVKMEDGEKPLDAAVNSSRELLIPLLISSLTTSAAFLAFFLAKDVMGEIVGPLFVVISFALLSSWLLTMTLVAMLGVAFIRVKAKNKGDAEEETPQRKSIFDRLQVYYDSLLAWALRRSWLFLGIVVALFVGSLMLFPQLPFIFFPDSDRNLITLDLNLPLGTKIERTQEVMLGVETYINEVLSVPEDSEKLGIIGYATFVGEGPPSYDLGYQPGEANSGYAHMLINTSRYEANSTMMQRLDSFLFATYPDAEIRVGPLAGGGGGGADVEVRLSGNDPEVLFRLTESIKQKIYRIPYSKNLKDDWGNKIKKFVIDIDQSQANRANLSNQDIAISLQTSLKGFTAGSYREDEDNIPIVLRSDNNLDLDVRQLDGVNIFAQSTGQNVPLGQVADVLTEFQYAKVKRRDLFRTITISCDAAEGFTASEITNELTPWLEAESANWPAGYDYTLGGESEQSEEGLGAVIAQLPLSGFIILLLLVIQFNSIRQTAIILLSIPLGLIGVIIGLYLFQSFFGFMAFLGVISLAGIIINNAIVLIDRIRIEQEELGKAPFEAIVSAAKQRFRPILLTTFTTTLGLIPLYLGGGLLWEPMAVSIMIGLLFGTMITLLFVPVTYKLFFRVKPENT